MEGTPIYEKLIAGPSDDWDMPVAGDKQILGGVKVFDTIAQRDAWAAKYPSRLPDTVALVGNGENKYPSWYKWETTWHFSGYFGGFVIADMDGELTHVDSTGVLGPDFKLQATGDQGDRVMIMLSDEAKKRHPENQGITVGHSMSSDYTQYVVPEINFTPPLTFKAQRANPGSPPTAVSVEIPPSTFESHHNEGYLAYFNSDEVIIGKAIPIADNRKGPIWAGTVAWGVGNVDLYPERETKSLILQDPYNEDPSVTGGAPIFCGIHLSFYGKAPDDGTIELYLWDAEKGGNLLNSEGLPIGFIHHYKSGDEINPITCVDIYKAKGAVKAQWRIKHTFTDDPIKMKDWEVGDSCIVYQIMGKGESISPALNEFQSVIGKPVRVMQKWLGQDFKSNSWELGFDNPQQTLTANQGQDSVLGIDIENPTPIKATVQNSIVNFKDDGTHPALFNLGLELSHEETLDLRGREVKVSVEVFNRYEGINLVMFSYRGDVSKAPRPVLLGESDGSYTLAEGWDNHESAFLAEHPEGLFHPLVKNFVIPNFSNLIMFGLLPASAQSPMDFSCKPMTVDVVDPFMAYEVSIPKSGNELMFNEVSSEFITRNALWVVDETKTNLPLGTKGTKLSSAPVQLSSGEDDDNAYAGGLELTSVTDYSIEIWINVLNFYKTKQDADNLVSFWVEDTDGHKVANSETNIVIKDGDFASHVVHWRFNYQNATEGTVLKLYGTSTVAKAAFLYKGTDNAVGVIVNAKVIP